MYWGIRARAERLGAPVIVVHGDCSGGDRMAEYIAGRLGIQTEKHPVHLFPSPRVRNQYMVTLGAEACVACATDWASGTGMCARMARRAGIPVFDVGVDTRPRSAVDGPAYDQDQTLF